ncbi:MAG: E3 ubiquitin-protein ligase hrd1 [Chaenotheca gracillima]|nr:MAG: E3 ubiquitin-protein ligase hrd1 [Chaenotheca gracillima]
MPTYGNLLRKHPSSDTVRNQPKKVPPPILPPPPNRRREGIIGSSPGSPQVRDFEPRSPRTRERAESAGAALSSHPPIPDDEAIVEMPNLSELTQHAINVPTRTSSSRYGPSFSTVSPSSASNENRSRRDSLTSVETYDTGATSTLPPLQTKGPPDEADTLEPLLEDDPASYNLVAPAEGEYSPYNLETRSDQLFSSRHLEMIFADPSLLLKFTSFLKAHRPRSVPVLVYYLDAKKALRAIYYSNAVAEALDPLDGHDFTTHPARSTTNTVLEDRAKHAFQVLVRDDLPAYITHIYTQVVSVSICRRITGTLPSHLREASEGLAEVFVLTDPSREDNPIVFASEEFHRTTQYGMNYVIGRNCRFLQGPRTKQHSVARLREASLRGKEHCEVFLNYRRDGSPFMNLLMIAPLCDSRGQIRYFIGAQVDVSGVVKDCTDLESLRRLVIEDEGESEDQEAGDGKTVKQSDTRRDEFQELSEMFNMQELDIVRRWGGRMHRDTQEDDAEDNWHRPRLMISEPSPEFSKVNPLGGPVSGKLSGVYQHYLLVRPYPSLRVLFASPSLRTPGILQSPFMSRIGGSTRVQDELIQALAEGRGVTAKVRWVSRDGEEGRNRWIHCTPLLGSNAQIGVWMVVVVDDEKDAPRRWRQPPPVSQEIRKRGQTPSSSHGQHQGSSPRQTGPGSTSTKFAGSYRSTSPSSLRIE